jgi:hypothetical protein
VKKESIINELLSCSAELEKELTLLFKLPPYDDTDRIRSSHVMCGVGFEHAESVKILIASGNFTSAMGVLRLQYEAFVRAVWLLYAATDSWTSKLMEELTQDSVRKANNLPLLSKMLEKLEGNAPTELLNSILEFKEYSWKPLSSFIHGGIHAIHRHNKGYPAPLLVQTLKASNGLSLMVGMLVVILSGDKSQSGKMAKLQVEYIKCLPELKNS